MAKGVPSGECRGCNTSPPPPNFLEFVGILTKCVVTFPDLMLSVNLEYFVIKNKMQNPFNIQSRINQTVTGDEGF